MKPEFLQPAKSRYGWVIVAVSFVMMGMGFGILVNISVFLKPLVAEFGWSRGETAFAFTAGTIAAGLTGIMGGWQSGVLFDITGTYTVSYASAAMAGVVNLIILGFLQRHITQRQLLLQAQPGPA